MSASRRTPARRTWARRRARFAALVTAVCALVGAIGVATGAEAAPFLRPAAASTAGVTHYTLGTLAFDGNGRRTSAIVGNGGRLVLNGGFSVRWTGQQAPARLSLQRKVGSGAWTTTAAKVTRTAHGLVARTPAYSTTATKRTVSYRIRSAAYSTATARVASTSVSRTLQVVVENQHRYTGLAMTVYRAVEAYCPATAVHVGSLSQGAGDYRTGTLMIRIAGEVRLYSARDVRAVALHECSHERQWLNYGGTTAGWNEMEAAADATFADWTKPDGAQTAYRYDDPDPAISPIEHGADCGAQSANPGGYLGYGGYCSKAQLAAGKRLLAGKRY